MTKHCLFILLCAICSLSVSAQKRTMLSGKIISAEDKSIIDFATVYLKGTAYGCTTDERGIYHLKAPAGTYTLIVSAIGYETFEEQITLQSGTRTRQTIALKTMAHELDEVEVVSSGVSRIQKSAFNAVAVDTKELHNSTKSLSEALMQLPGLKLRESGGVGSDMQLMLDGFSGKHVKVFIDGVRVIGERINPTGKKAMKAALIAGESRLHRRDRRVHQRNRELESVLRFDHEHFAGTSPARSPRHLLVFARREVAHAAFQPIQNHHFHREIHADGQRGGGDDDAHNAAPHGAVEHLALIDGESRVVVANPAEQGLAEQGLGRVKLLQFLDSTGGERCT